MIFETERLICRRWAETDALAAFAIYGDAEVMRYLGPGNVTPDPDPTHSIKGLIKTNERLDARGDGTGFWAMEVKDTADVVGCVFLAPLSEDEIEVGYHLARAHWGKGYATEAARAALTYGFEKAGLKRIVALCYPENTASLRVLEKLEMNHEGQKEFFGKALEYFSQTLGP